MDTWTKKDAKARFSEFLDKCLTEGAQRVTRRGAEAAVLVPALAWRRVQHVTRPGQGCSHNPLVHERGALMTLPRRHALLLAALLASSGLAQAQATAPAFSLRGTAFDGSRIDLAQSRGKVVLLFYWSTDCAVCRDKLPELRANAAGWRSKPFQTVLVSVDRRKADAMAYDAASSTTLRPEQRFPTLWRGDAGYADSLGAAPTKLPLTLVLDTQGRVAQRFEGRVPAEAWDAIAELLP